ncbi:hypothetical protein KJY73_03325 [Bowmanella sp. Y26]|uniref:hypothetical protein n=1 Tax=Bowmanella yangjiangensis TaxID=2811230 RepID=UPI001BDCD4F6|nr:hypothetical protein [Bowmanella yangjiangensis]MBT1062587.1 hypothetical protein [Bowmanella yangjiangensis]
MESEEYKKLKEALGKEYVLITQGRLWSLFGGFLGVLVAVGFISFNSAKNALESSTAAKTIAELKDFHAKASRYTEEIEAYRNHNKEKIEKFELYFSETERQKLALANAEKELDKRVMYNSNIEIHNAKLPHLVMDVDWPRGNTPSKGTKIQVYDDKSNDAQTWQIRKD